MRDGLVPNVSQKLLIFSLFLKFGDSFAYISLVRTFNLRKVHSHEIPLSIKTLCTPHNRVSQGAHPKH